MIHVYLYQCQEISNYIAIVHAIVNISQWRRQQFRRFIRYCQKSDKFGNGPVNFCCKSDQTTDVYIYFNSWKIICLQPFKKLSWKTFNKIILFSSQMMKTIDLFWPPSFLHIHVGWSYNLPIAHRTITVAIVVEEKT